MLDMSLSKIHRIRVAASRNGIPFPEPALYAGLGGTTSYWLKDIVGWVRDIRAAEIDWSKPHLMYTRARDEAPSYRIKPARPTTCGPMSAGTRAHRACGSRA